MTKWEFGVRPNYGTGTKNSDDERGRQKGQVLVTFAFCMVVLVCFMGLAIDMGYLRFAKRKMQSAADSAAVAGGTQLMIGGVSGAAQADAAQNGYTNGTNGVVVTVNNPPAGGSHTGTSYVEVIVSQPQPTFFMKIFGVNSAAMTARAVATLGSSSTGCIYALNPNGTSITNSGNVNVQAPTCGIVANGNVTFNGNVTVNAGSIGVNGTYTKNGGSGSVSPTPTTGIAEVSDPLAYLTPPAVGGCSAFPSTPTVNPGTYCSISLNGGTTTFNPGLYITTGGMSVHGNATVNGNGVTIYVDSGSVSFAGNSTVNLSAPTSGADAGILFWQNPSDTSGATMLGNNTANLAGALYFPKAPLDIGGTNGTSYIIMVADTITFHGTPNIGSNYSSLGGGSPIKDALLVE